MSGIRKYPKGATHCLYPTAMDELFFRKAKVGKHLEYFAMGSGCWYESTLPVSQLEKLHKLEDPDAVIG
jgi:hypothetical protein